MKKIIQQDLLKDKEIQLPSGARLIRFGIHLTRAAAWFEVLSEQKIMDSYICKSYPLGDEFGILLPYMSYSLPEGSLLVGVTYDSQWKPTIWVLETKQEAKEKFGIIVVKHDEEVSNDFVYVSTFFKPNSETQHLYQKVW